MTLDNLKILLVEDDELFRLGLQVRLQQETKIAGLVEASDGETAIDLAKAQTFDLVLLDIGLPAYIQQVFWAKKYLPRKSEGFRDPILNSKFFVEN